jgi:hypothetical protein
VTLRVYGRTEYAEPLTERSSVATLDDMPTGEWVELVAIPEEAIHWIVRDGEDADDG